MNVHREPLLHRRVLCGWLVAVFALLAPARAQLVVVNETFRDTTFSSGSSWVVGGTNYTPNLTAASGLDAPGSGWLRLTSAGGQQATYAYDSQSFNGADATIAVKFSYAAYGGTGADGITFFLADASKTFSVGAYGGSLGYAQKTLAAGGEADIQGMNGGYIGLGIDEFGNYSNATEGRIGGIGFNPGNVSVRGPGSGYSGYDYLGGTGSLSTPIAFTGTTRPTGDNARIFQVVITATNQLTVYMQAGETAPMEALYSIDLSGYARPEDLILGFTGSTGGSTNIHEIQGLSLTSLKADLWTNGGGTSTWANGANWDGTDGNIPEVGADILLNNRYVSTAQTIDVGGTRSIRSLQIDAPFAYTLNSGTLQFNDQGVLGPSGIFVSKGNGSANHTVNSALVAQNAITITNTSNGTLQLNGTLDNGGNAVTLSGTGTTNLAGTISGTGSITKLGAGEATLSGNNTYSGGTTLQAGTLTAGHNNAFGTGDLTVKGGTLASNAANVIGNNIALQGSAGLSNVTTSGTLTQTGGSYTLTMANATQSGVVNLSNNTTARTLTVAVDSGTSTVSGVIQNGGGSSAGNLAKTGSGTLILGGANTYTGTTSIDAGTLQLAASDRLADTSSVSIGASGTLNLNGYSDKIGGLAAIGGATLNFGTPTGANTFIFGNYTAPASGVLVVNNWQQGIDTLATSVGGQSVSTVYFSGFGVAQVAGTLSDNIYGTGSNGAYLLTPMAPAEIEWDGSTSTRWDTGSNWTTGAAPTSTQVALFDDAGLGRLTPTIRANTTIAGIRFGDKATASYNLTNSFNRTLTLSGTVPYIQQQSASNQAISIRTLALGASTVADITGAGNLTISSIISGTNAALIKDGNGAGKLILSGNNTFTGGLYVNNGTAQANSNTALGTGTATVSPGATLEVSGNRTITNALSLSGAGVGGNGALRSVAGTNTFSGTITETGDTTIGADSGTTLNLTGNLTGTAVDTTFVGAGNLSVNRITTGTGGVTLNGTGTVTMAGTTTANTYTGTTAVNSGTLVLSKSAGTTALAGNLVIGDGVGAGSSAVVRLGAANQIADTAAVVLGSDGLFNLNGAAETIASLAGSGVIDNASTTATTLTFGDTGSTTFSGVIQDSSTGNLSLIKRGSGKITLTGANTYAGTTSLTNGIIAIQHNTALGSGATTISSGANLEVAGGLTVANAIALNGPGTLANDGAIQSTAGANTLTGNLTLQSASRLVADASSSLTLGGTAAITSTAGSAQNLSFGGAGDITVNKVIGSATAANNVGTLTKDGDGTLVLTAANLFSGATTINAGTLEIRSNAGLGATASGTTVASGATLALSNNITSAEAQINLSGAGAGGAGALRNLSGANTLSGAIALNAAATIGVDAGSLTASGVVSGANSLTKVGAGTLTLSGTAANTFSGGATVKDGTLILAKTAGVRAVGTGDVTIGDASGAANSAVVQLTNANQIGATANVTVNADGQLNLNSKNETIGSLAGSGNVALGTGNTLIVGNSTSTVFTGAVTTTGTGAVTKTGTGTLQIGGTDGANSFAAATLNLTQGTVQLGANNILATALNFNGGTFSVNGFSDTVNSATLTSSSILDFNSLSGVFDLSSGIYIGGTLTINGWAGSISGGGASQLLLGGTISGALLANINFTGYGAGAQIVNGEIVPITGTVYTWQATGSGNWVVDANWTPDPAGTDVGPTGTGVSVIFGSAIAADSTVTLSAGKTVGYMTFNDNNRYTISGSTVTMDVNSGSAQINVSGSGGGTIASNLALSDALQIAQNSSGQFVVSGNITGTARNLTIGGSGDTLISGSIATTTGTLTKNNTGTLTLSGTNTFTGATTVNGGVLAISNETNLGSNPAALNAGQLTLNGGTLQTTTNAVMLDDANRGVTIGASGGTFETVSNLTIGGSGATNILAINGPLTKTGSATLTFTGTGANTGNGAINVNAGTLALAKSANVSALGDTAAVSVASGATLQFNGTSAYTAETIGSLAGAGTVTNASATAFALTTGGAGTSTTFSGALQNTGGALSLTKTGAGTLTLTDTAGASNYTGTTTVSGGVLNLRAGTALGSTVAGTTVASGAALELQGGIAVGAEALSLTGTGVGANGALRNVSGNNSFAGAITLAGATEIQTDSDTLTLTGGIGGTQNLTLSGLGNTTVSGVIATGSGTLTKSDSGYAVLSGANTFTGATSITGGTLEIRNNAGLGTTAGATTVSAGGTLALSSGVTTAEGLTINGVGASSAGALRSLSGANTVTGTVALGSSSLVGVDADTLNVSGVVTGTGFTLTKVGAGTLALNATNTYSGGTAINAGTVQIGADRGLGAIPGTATAGNVTLNGGTLATTYTGALSTNRGVALGAAGGAISPSAGTTLTYGGIVAGTGALTKSGDGTLTLTGVNTYSGGTTISAGTLSINSDARLGTAPGSPSANHLTFAGGTLAISNNTVLNPNRGVQVSAVGGKITVANGTTLSFGSTITGPGELELALGGTGVFTLTNDVNWSGGSLALGGGTFRLAGYDLSVGTLRITGDTILDFGSGVGSILTTANVIIQEGATLTITNWVNGADQFIATNSFASSNGTQAQYDVTGAAPQNQVVFTGFGGNATRWSSYDNQITPVPEPSTYGLLLLSGCIGLFAWRRWKKRSAPGA